MQFSQFWLCYPEQLFLCLSLCVLLILNRFFLSRPNALKAYFYGSILIYAGLFFMDCTHLFVERTIFLFFLLSFFFFSLCADQLFYFKTAQVEKRFFMLVWLFALYLLVYCDHWVFLYIAFELVSFPFYVWPLISNHPNRYKGVSKYFITQIVLNILWISSLAYAQIAHPQTSHFFHFFLSSDLSSNLLCCSTLLMILTKIGTYPMGYWLADLYTIMNREQIFWFGFVPKFFLLCFFARFIDACYLSDQALLFVAVLILIGSYWGHFLATYEKNIQRFLGFTTIAQNGFLCLPVCLMGSLGLLMSLFYLVMYNVGLLLVLYGVQRSFIEDLGDLFGRTTAKVTLLSYGIGLCSLAGFPPSPGFFAKISVLISLCAYSWEGRWLGFALLVSSLIGLYYYMNWLLLLPRSMVSRLDEQSPVLY